MTEPSGRPAGQGEHQLPENHLALVIEDLLEVVDARAGVERPPAPDLRAILLYGWATGARGAGEIVRRESLDAGLRYLLGGDRPNADSIRGFRDEQAASLEVLLTQVFALCQSAGLTSLGELWLDRSSSEGAGRSIIPVWLARQVLTSSRAADVRESGDRPTLPVPLPTWAATRPERQATLQAAGGGARRAADRAQPAAPLTTVIARGAAVLILLLGGLMAVRWLATGPVSEPVRAAGSRPPVPGELIEDPPIVALAAPTAEPVMSSELQAAHSEAMHLAFEALEDDDLLSARSFYQFARGIMPDDEEAETRIRQLNTVLLIANRRDGWTDILEDLADLREVVPGSPTVLRAYVDGLVGAGREALADRSLRRAGDLCGEAARWFPDRLDARQCLAQSGFAPTSTPFPTARPTPIPPSPTSISTSLVSPTIPSLGEPGSPTAAAASPSPVIGAPTAPLPPTTAPTAVPPPSVTSGPAAGFTVVVPTPVPPTPTTGP